MHIAFRRFVEVASYYLGVDSLFYWLNRDTKRTVTFHNVLPDDEYAELGDKKDGTTVAESVFRKTVKELRRRFRLSVDLDDPTSLTITFDDGYNNQVDVAARVLKEEGNIPAVLFLSGRAFKATHFQDALYPDLLIYWGLLAPIDAVNEMCGVECRSVAIGILFKRAEADVDKRGQSIIRQLNGVYSFDKIFAGFSASFLRHRFTGMSMNDIARLRREGWIIGWHSENHFSLAKLSSQEQARELTPPQWIASPILSYPYGTPDHIGTAHEIAEACGLDKAYTNVIEDSHSSSRYRLGRFVLSNDRYALHFTLSGLKYFLKYHKLLPR